MGEDGGILLAVIAVIVALVIVSILVYVAIKRRRALKEPAAGEGGVVGPPDSLSGEVLAVPKKPSEPSRVNTTSKGGPFSKETAASGDEVEDEGGEDKGAPQRPVENVEGEWEIPMDEQVEKNKDEELTKDPFSKKKSQVLEADYQIEEF
jgi:hypothetical protein